MAVTQSIPAQESISTLRRQVGKLQRQLADEADKRSRLWRALVLLHQLQRETGSLEGAGRLVHQWCGGRLDSTQRLLRQFWNQGLVPSADTVAKLQATVARDRYSERKARLAAIAERVEVDLAAIDAAEAGTEADRLDGIG